MTLRALQQMIAATLGALMLLVALPGPAQAHEEHKKEQLAKAAAETRQRQLADGNAQAMHEGMGEMMMETGKERSQMGLAERLLDWLGRTHPVIVHFPIAFFPAALFTAVVGRNRPAFSAPVQFLVVAGGIIAPVSALFGWFNAGFGLADSDPLLMVHRWLGTAIGVGGLALAIWAWKRPWEDRRRPMIAALAAITAAIIVQGWYGGALVHGMEHMDW